MKILLIGGTRFFGREAALQLLREGHEVHVLTRGNTPVPEGVHHLAGDRNEPESLRHAALGDFDAVLDNVAYSAAHVSAALDAFEGRTGHYVFTSSTAVYMVGGLRAPYLEEAAPPEVEASQGDDSPGWRYSIGKIEAERLLLGQDRVPFTIVRPPVVIGPNDPTLRLHAYVQRILDGGPLLLVDSGQQVFHLADSEDLGGAYALVLARPETATGKAYNVCQRDVVMLEELIRAAAAALERPASLVPIPGAVLRQAGFDYHEPIVFPGPPMITPPERAVRELGFRPRPILESVARAALWHAEHSGQAMPGYERRPQEIELAARYLAATARLGA
jgi:nucleoside-diphosphate-sugar epimerase